MQFLIAVVPPESYKKKVIEFQKQWKNNSISDVIEPHITVKAQGGLTENKEWINQVEKVCENFNSFQVTLNKPQFFGDSVVFLSVESKEIYDLHKELVRVVSPNNDLVKRYMELDDYVPHFTLGQTFWGLTSLELKEMSKKAEVELVPFPTFDANFIRIYQEIESNKYIKYLDLPLMELRR